VGLFQSDLEPEDLTIKILHFKNCWKITNKKCSAIN
jgi:hypothetical protein